MGYQESKKDSDPRVDHFSNGAWSSRESLCVCANSDGDEAYGDDDTGTSDEQLIRKALGMEDSEEEDGNASMMLDEQALHELVARELTGDSTNDNDSVIISLPETSDGTGMDMTPPLPPERQRHLTGRCPTILYLSCDPETLSDYQCLVRKQIELFEANENDVMAGAQGRNKPIVLGQVRMCRRRRWRRVVMTLQQRLTAAGFALQTGWDSLPALCLRAT
jgi:hypothetical protein